MKVVSKAMKQMYQNAGKDKMTYVVLAAPMLCGLILYYGIEAAEMLLCGLLQKEEVLIPYMELFYLLMLSTPALMLSYVAIMIVLDELDEGTAKYLCVTPLGKWGYLFSRFGLAGGVSIPYTVLLGCLFPMAKISLVSIISIVVILLIGIMFAGVGVIIALLVTVFSGNKVEGMAIMKLSGLLLIGMAIPYFAKGVVYYVGMVLPTFWIGEFLKDVVENAAVDIGRIAVDIVSFVVFAGIWVAVCYKKFVGKLI